MKNKFLLKIYILVTCGVILFVGVLHLLRVVYQVPVLVGTLAIPMFFSYFGLAGSIGVVILAVWLLVQISKR